MEGKNRKRFLPAGSAGGDLSGKTVYIIISGICDHPPGRDQGHGGGGGALQFVAEIQVRHRGDHGAAADGAENLIQGRQGRQSVPAAGCLPLLGKVGAADGDHAAPADGEGDRAVDHRCPVEGLDGRCAAVGSLQGKGQPLIVECPAECPAEGVGRLCIPAK